MKKKFKVLIAGAEVAPFAKVGGLGDVMGSLPQALKKKGVDVRVVMPLYGSIKRRKYGLKKIYSNFEIPSNMELLLVNIWEGKLPGTSVKIYFIEQEKHFGSEDVYVKGDNSERFLFFSLAMLYMTPLIEFIPDIYHLQDSHVALAADVIKTSNIEYIKNIKTLYTIHNFNYQGKSGIKVLSTGNLSEQSLKSLTVDALDGDINFMAQGVLNADLVNTVSETYAKEITTDFYGAGLDNVIKKRKKDLFGIVNGIDVDFFNPRKDKYIKERFSEKSLEHKIHNKLYIQKKLGLPVREDVAICSMITRLAWQKGLELFSERYVKLGCQFIFLGTGDKKYEKQLSALARKYPDIISANITFSVPLAQEIYAASDIFLMPSRYEPCGLGQMIAMRYGALTVARATGGLKDTVTPDVGFTFDKVSTREFYNSLKEALRVYYKEPKKWEKMVVRAMKKDFSWDKSAGEYLKLYKKLLK